MPTLSVILTNYNHAALLPRALDAILAQSRPADEVLLIDDASRDNSVAVMEDYQRRHPVIRILRNPTNLGVLLTANKAAATAKGDYLYFAAADDEVLPGFFEHGMALAERHPEAGLVCGMTELRTPEDRLIATMGVRAWNVAGCFDPQRALVDYFEREPAAHSLCGGTLYRRTPFLELGGYNPGLGPWGDTFVARSLALRHGMGYVPRPFMIFYVYPNSYSQKAGFADMLDVVARAAHAMRQPPFDALFPADFVARWKRRYLRELAESDIYNRAPFLTRLLAKVLKRVPLVGLGLYRGMVDRTTLRAIKDARRPESRPLPT